MWIHVSCNCIASWCFFGNWMLWALIFGVQYFALSMLQDTICHVSKDRYPTKLITQPQTKHVTPLQKRTSFFPKVAKTFLGRSEIQFKSFADYHTPNFEGTDWHFKDVNNLCFFPQRPRHFFQKTPPEFLQPSIYIRLNGNASRSLMEKHGRC